MIQFYKADEAPGVQDGIGSLLAANIIEFLMFFGFRYAFKYENRKKQKLREAAGIMRIPI